MRATATRAETRTGTHPGSDRAAAAVVRPQGTAVVRNLGNAAVGRLFRVPAFGGAEADVEAERQYGNSGAPKATTCGAPSHCPPAFCQPYRSQKLAEYHRAKSSWWIMAGIRAAVDGRVAPLWQEYLNGGSPPKNLTADFGADFTASPTTRKVTDRLKTALEAALVGRATPVRRNSTTSIDIATLVPRAIADLGDPVSPDQMNFSVVRDIAGNLAGGIGADQTTCPAGAQPSPFNDSRRAHGTVELRRGGGSGVVATPKIAYTVKDTIDLCPGDCGTSREQIATVPLSQFEATGISGDVPFTVEFPAPDRGTFTLRAPLGPDP